MFSRFIVRSMVNGLALWICTIVLPGVIMLTDPMRTFLGLPMYSTAGQVVAWILIGAVFGIVNTFIRPLIALFSLPAYLFTFGLFFIVVNAIVIQIVSGMTFGFNLPAGLYVKSFGWALLAGIVVGCVNTIVDAFLPAKFKR